MARILKSNYLIRLADLLGFELLKLKKHSIYGTILKKMHSIIK